MNSLSRTHCNDNRDTSRKSHHDDDCFETSRKSHHNDDCFETSRKSHKENNVALKCGTPGSATIVGTSTTPVTVSTLSVNTSCFENPCIKLEFTSNIAFSAGTPRLNLQFQIFRICNNQVMAIPVGPAFNINPPTGGGSTDAFTFFVCDCDSCFNDRCTYTVVVTPSGGTGESGTVTITNATLAAIIVDNSNKCGC